MGWVSIEWGEQRGQLTPDEARQHALSILAAAESAEHDALFVQWGKRLGMGHEQMGAALLDLRQLRDAGAGAKDPSP